jgi:peptidoglycan-associated lipoprotein
MRKGLYSVLSLFVAVAFLTACEGTTATKKDDTSTSSGSSSSSTSSGSGASSTGMASSGSWAGHPLDDPNSLLSKRTVYFDFDKSVILEGDRAVLEAHARYLSDNPGATVTLEGHADERGTREYNMALGERRSVATRQYMSLLGGAGQQLRTVSYGEERPAAMGHHEEAWALNRRVEIIYRTR